MEQNEREYHEALASTADQAKLFIRKGEHTLVRVRYLMGKRLNAVYGPNPIPFLDLETLHEIYGDSSPLIDKARQFAARVPDETQALERAEEYDNWTGIVKGFLPEYTPKKYREITKGVKAKNQTRRHLSNVSDRLRDDLVDDGGMSLNEAQDAIRLYLFMANWKEVKAAYDNRHNLRAWQEMQS